MIFLMIRALPVSGLPYFAAEDLDRDSRIDLPPDPTDAILSVTESGRSAEKEKNASAVSLEEAKSLLVL
ncbi:MAG: hypothetical protein V2I97_10270 [Desulfococcaceae bacterium]|jgi:hypothetical protein|nr:hypothetical protein [Desulfococcaceae bacterium]